MAEKYGVLRIHELLCKAFEEKNYQPFSYTDARRFIQTVPGTSWPSGTTIDDILNNLAEMDLVFWGRAHGMDEKILIPLAYDS